MIFLALKSQKKWLSCELNFTRIQLYCRSWKGCAKSLKYFSGPAIFDGLAHFYSQDVNWLVDLEYNKARKICNIFHQILTFWLFCLSKKLNDFLTTDVRSLQLLFIRIWFGSLASEKRTGFHTKLNKSMPSPRSLLGRGPIKGFKEN